LSLHSKTQKRIAKYIKLFHIVIFAKKKGKTQVKDMESNGGMLGKVVREGDT
jgi:hypothetical protein